MGARRGYPALGERRHGLLPLGARSRPASSRRPPRPGKARRGGPPGGGAGGATGRGGLGGVVAAFGEGVLGPEGDLDRRRMAERIFSDPSARARLESIVHPRVRALFRRERERLTSDGHAVAFYDVPLLYAG